MMGRRRRACKEEEGKEEEKEEMRGNLTISGCHDDLVVVLDFPIQSCTDDQV